MHNFALENQALGSEAEKKIFIRVQTIIANCQNHRYGDDGF
jgi:hypothetical protein